MSAMPHLHAPARIDRDATRARRRSIALTITTGTGTTGPEVRTRVHD
jgi:hypothetical protein